MRSSILNLSLQHSPPQSHDWGTRRGLKTEMPFSKGGYRQPPLLINFACNDAAFANFLYRKLEPYVRKNAQKAASNGFIEEFISSKEFKAVAREADKVSRLFWSVKYGKGVGVYFQSSEALHSIDTATTHLRQGFAFRTFTEAVRFQMGTQKNPANRVYKYDLSQPDLAQQVRQILAAAPEPSPPPSDSDGAAESEPESVFEGSSRSMPAAPIPQTPRRPPPTSADGYAAVPRSPHVFIQVNTPVGAPTAIEPGHLNEQYWGRQLLMALGLSDAAARKLGFRATTTQSADFELYCEEKYAEKVNNRMAKANDLEIKPFLSAVVLGPGAWSSSGSAMVSRKTAEKKDRLSNMLRKAGSVKRKPTLNQRRPRIKISRAERLQKKKQLRERKVAYKAALSEVYEEIRSLADGVHAKFPNIPVDRILTDIYQSQRLKDSSKELSLYSAFTSAEMDAVNSKIPEGQDKKKVHEMSKAIADKWAGMSKDEQVAASKDQLAVLRERRESKELGTWHNADVSANHDTSMSVARIKEELTRLSSWTGDESLLIIVRGSITRFHQPESFTSSERAENFVYTALKMSSVDLSLKMDAYMVLGIEGVARNQAQALLDLKAKTSALILERLMKNWPLKEFKSPGSINTHADLTVLLNAWTSGTTYFHKMTTQEYEDWAASGCGSVDAHEVEEVAGVAEDGAIAESSVSPPTPSAASPSTEQSSQPEASTSSSNAFVFTHMVTNGNGEAVSTTKRARKKRSDAGKPRKKRTKAVEVEGSSNVNEA
ncbi:hypothetical protein F5878DRAFT_669753 [Lentinula raphanica]|uniref:Uncharacterized protein n=1 Tax=Lentinula raphanica TaxID=153919 RepID=A0AA38UHG8_9AGAR|nr:hypothetical protein F5878DRAFT_669753 [Lentinula raphanica]